MRKSITVTTHYKGLHQYSVPGELYKVILYLTR